MNYEEFFAWLSQDFPSFSPFVFIVGVVAVSYVFSRFSWLAILYSGDVLYTLFTELISWISKLFRKAKDKR